MLRTTLCALGLLSSCGCESDQPAPATGMGDADATNASASTPSAGTSSAGMDPQGDTSPTGGTSSGGSSGNAAADGNEPTPGSEAAAGNGGTEGDASESSEGGASGEGGAPMGGGAGATPTGGQSTGGGSGQSTGGAGGQSTGGAGGQSEACLEFDEPELVGTAEAAPLSALSGLVASRAQPGVFYVHADASGSGTVYAIDSSGSTLAEYVLVDAPGNDWEDVAVGPGPDGTPHLFVADTGDNPARTGSPSRTQVEVLRLPEPEVPTEDTPIVVQVEDFDVLVFTYPESQRDSESLFVDPLSSDIVLITRDNDGESGVYRAPGSTAADSATVLELVAEISVGTQSTAADISPSGDRVVLRTQNAALLWQRMGDLAQAFAAEPLTLPIADEAQCEGISFAADANSIYSSGEQTADIYQSLAICL